jgi:hypothetical protein
MAEIILIYFCGCTTGDGEVADHGRRVTRGRALKRSATLKTPVSFSAVEFVMFHYTVCLFLCLRIQECSYLMQSPTHRLRDIIKFFVSYIASLKVKQSLYTPWRRFGGEEI